MDIFTNFMNIANVKIQIVKFAHLQCCVGIPTSNIGNFVRYQCCEQNSINGIQTHNFHNSIDVQNTVIQELPPTANFDGESLQITQVQRSDASILNVYQLFCFLVIGMPLSFINSCI